MTHMTWFQLWSVVSVELVDANISRLRLATNNMSSLDIDSNATLDNGEYTCH